MQSGHYIFVFSAPPLFGVSLTNYFKRCEYQITSILYSEAVICSTGIEQSLIFEIRQREFDENTIGDTFDSSGVFTAPVNFGANSSEKKVFLYDDIRDFKGYNKNAAPGRPGVINTCVELKGVLWFKSLNFINFN